VQIPNSLARAALATLLLSGITSAYAEPNSALYELEARCGQQAVEYFERNIGRQGMRKEKDGATTFPSFENHYNPALNRCFIVVYQLSTYPTPGTYVFRYIKDINNNRLVGTFMQQDTKSPDRCVLNGKQCQSEDQWKELVKPYIEGPLQY
jgi:hypothetical protein